MADADQDSAGDSGGKRKYLKFILIPVILLAQGIAGYYLVFNVILDDPGAKNPAKKKLQVGLVGQFFELNDLVVNPAGSGGKKYLVLEIGLETTLPDLIVEAEDKEVWIRDAIITLLSQITTEELSEFANRRSLKQEMLKQINRRLSGGDFTHIYFTKYLIQ